LAADHSSERVVYPLPCSVFAPGEEDPVDGFPVREVVWQQPPCTTAAEDVEGRVDDRPTANRPGPSGAGRLWPKFEEFAIARR
jgi:hypothetical protein